MTLSVGVALVGISIPGHPAGVAAASDRFTTIDCEPSPFNDTEYGSVTVLETTAPYPSAELAARLKTLKVKV